MTMPGAVGKFLSRLLLSFTLLLVVYPGKGYALEIALSFDDAPKADGAIFTGTERTQRLIDTLREKGVSEVAFFCNTIHFSDEGQARLKRYAAAGHIIANHTATHLNLLDPSIDEKQYIKDIEQADEQLSQLPNFRRWFRYPYLRQSTQIGAPNNAVIELFLQNRQYKHGYVTIETYDWHLDKLIRQDIQQGRVMDYAVLKQIYIDILWDSIVFYDALAKKILGHSPRHVILLHENDINALFIGDLIDHIEKNGGVIIPISHAYADDIAAPKWDGIPLSQRRIRALAKLKQYRGSTVSLYEEESAIEQRYHAGLADQSV
jgi:peptidoglycan/xylan/chitin deacetylase (PgdA/CDA1 family)